MSMHPEIASAIGRLIEEVGKYEGGIDAVTQARIVAINKIVNEPLRGPVTQDTMALMIGFVAAMRPDLDDVGVIVKVMELLPIVLPRLGTKEPRLVQSARGLAIELD